jgi:hypothetical protein
VAVAVAAEIVKGAQLRVVSCERTPLDRCLFSIFDTDIVWLKLELSLGCHVYAKRDVVLVMRKGSCSRDVKWCHLDRVSMRILRLGSPVGVKHGTHGHGEHGRPKR